MLLRVIFKHELEYKKSGLLLMLLRKANYVVTAALLGASPAFCDEIISEQLENFAEICDARLLPEERISLWLSTGSTIAIEEQDCMSRMAAKETIDTQNRYYFDQKQDDLQFRVLSIDPLSIHSTINSESDSAITEKIQIKSDRVRNELPIDTLTSPDYRSITR